MTEMVENVSLTSPFVTVHLAGPMSRRRFRAYLAGWVVFWFAVVASLIYAYAVPFAAWVGFETALLVGVAFIALTVGADD